MRIIILIVLCVILISPFLLLYLMYVNLFENQGFIAIYLTVLVVVGLNSITDLSIEFPGFKSTAKNTGASIEISENKNEKSYTVITHGSADDKKALKLIDHMRKDSEV